MKRFTHLLALTVTLLAMGTAALGQDYRFRVPKAEMRVFVQPDASVRVVYDITFHNQQGAHPIDIVDIGTLAGGYNLGSVVASAGGVTLTDVRRSEVVSPGFEVHLGPATIMPGHTGTVHVEYIQPRMVYQDTTDKSFASLQVTPAWFGSQYVQGQTELAVVVQLPKGIKPDDVKWHDVEFARKAVADDTVAVAWYWPATRLDHAHRVGVSFPKGDMPVVYMTKLMLLRKWFRESTAARLWLGLLIGAAWTFTYFRFSGGTGFSVYFILTAILIWVFVISPEAELISVPVVVVLLVWNEWALRRRKAHYMPPIAQVEGGGIKRGLTAPEAALLLELPLSKVLTLVIFGLLKKGVLRQINAAPLQVAVNDPFAVEIKELPPTPSERGKFYRKLAHQTGIPIHKYEHAFLYLIQLNPSKPLAEVNFTVPMKQLIAHVVRRVKNFDLSDTKDYYRSIIRRAMQQAKAIGDVPMREKMLDRHFEWILMDDDYSTVFTGRQPYWPIWCRGASYMPPGGGASVAEAAGSAAASAGQTTFGDVAASFAGWTENTMGSMASAIAPESLSAAQSSGGILNLSGADSLTSQVLSSLSEGSGGGGGGFSGGGCACACAGCACACACAGGGR